MPKHLTSIRLIINGDGYGPDPDGAAFEYIVCDVDDSQMRKNGRFIVANPNFTVDTIDEFFDGYISVIKSNEGIS